MPLDGHRLRFILSAGRTGTVFLSTILPRLCAPHEVVHEPPTSRRVFMLWNAEAAGLVPTGYARRVFMANRRRVLDELNTSIIRIEINPFLHTLAPELHQLVRPLRIVQLVRDPRDWITSMANFRAAGWRKYFIEFVPFARTIHPMARSNWRALDEISQFAWRWRLANEQLLDSSEHAEHYSLIRHEDLFSSDRSLARESVRRLLSICPPAGVDVPDDILSQEKINSSRTDRIGSWQNWPRETRDKVTEICGPLMAKFGYSEDC